MPLKEVTALSHICFEHVQQGFLLFHPWQQLEEGEDEGNPGGKSCLVIP